MTQRFASRQAGKRSNPGHFRRSRREPPVGIEPTTYALRGPSTPPPPPATCDFSAARLALRPSVYFIGRQLRHKPCHDDVADEAAGTHRARRAILDVILLRRPATAARTAACAPTHPQPARPPPVLDEVPRRMCSVTGTSSGLFADGSSRTGTASGTSQTHSARGAWRSCRWSSRSRDSVSAHVGMASNRSRLGVGRPVWRIASRRSPASAYISSGASRLCAPNHSSPLGPFSTRRQ